MRRHVNLSLNSVNIPAVEEMLSGSDHRSEKRNITPLDKQELDAGPPEAMEKVLVYPTGLKLAIIMFGLCLSVFCVALDNKIIATAIQGSQTTSMPYKMLVGMARLIF